MIDFIRKNTKHINLVFIVYASLCVLYGFIATIYGFKNTTVLNGFGNVFGFLISVSVLGLGVYGIICKKETLVTILLGATLIVTLYNGFIGFDFFFYKLQDAVNTDSGIYIVKYIIEAVEKLVLAGLTVCVFLFLLKKDESMIKIGTIFGVAEIVLTFILFIVRIVLIAKGYSTWYILITDLSSIAFATWVVLAINHERMLGKPEAKVEE